MADQSVNGKGGPRREKSFVKDNGYSSQASTKLKANMDKHVSSVRTSTVPVVNISTKFQTSAAQTRINSAQTKTNLALVEGGKSSPKNATPPSMKGAEDDEEAATIRMTLPVKGTLTLGSGLRTRDVMKTVPSSSAKPSLTTSRATISARVSEKLTRTPSNIEKSQTSSKGDGRVRLTLGSSVKVSAGILPSASATSPAGTLIGSKGSAAAVLNTRAKATISDTGSKEISALPAVSKCVASVAQASSAATKASQDMVAVAPALIRQRSFADAVRATTAKREEEPPPLPDKISVSAKLIVSKPVSNKTEKNSAGALPETPQYVRAPTAERPSQSNDSGVGFSESELSSSSRTSSSSSETSVLQKDGVTDTAGLLGTKNVEPKASMPCTREERSVVVTESSSSKALNSKDGAGIQMVVHEADAKVTGSCIQYSRSSRSQSVTAVSGRSHDEGLSATTAIAKIQNIEQTVNSKETIHSGSVESSIERQTGGREFRLVEVGARANGKHGGKAGVSTNQNEGSATTISTNREPVAVLTRQRSFADVVKAPSPAVTTSGANDTKSKNDGVCTVKLTLRKSAAMKPVVSPKPVQNRQRSNLTHNSIAVKKAVTTVHGNAARLQQRSTSFSAPKAKSRFLVRSLTSLPSGKLIRKPTKSASPRESKDVLASSPTAFSASSADLNSVKPVKKSAALMVREAAEMRRKMFQEQNQVDHWQQPSRTFRAPSEDRTSACVRSPGRFEPLQGREFEGLESMLSKTKQSEATNRGLVLMQRISRSSSCLAPKRRTRSDSVTWREDAAVATVKPSSEANSVRQTPRSTARSTSTLTSRVRTRSDSVNWRQDPAEVTPKPQPVKAQQPSRPPIRSNSTLTSRVRTRSDSVNWREDSFTAASKHQSVVSSSKVIPSSIAIIPPADISPKLSPPVRLNSYLTSRARTRSTLSQCETSSDRANKDISTKPIEDGNPTFGPAARSNSSFTSRVRTRSDSENWRANTTNTDESGGPVSTKGGKLGSQTFKRGPDNDMTQTQSEKPQRAIDSDRKSDAADAETCSDTTAEACQVSSDSLTRKLPNTPSCELKQPRKERSFIGYTNGYNKQRRPNQSMASVKVGGKPSIELYKPPSMRTSDPDSVPNDYEQTYAQEVAMQPPQRSRSGVNLPEKSGALLRSNTGTNFYKNPMVPYVMPMALIATPRVHFQPVENVAYRQVPPRMMKSKTALNLYANQSVIDTSVPPPPLVPPVVQPSGTPTLQRSKSVGSGADMKNRIETPENEFPDLGSISPDALACLKKVFENPTKASARTIMDAVRHLFSRLVESSKLANVSARLCMAIIQKEDGETFFESLINACQEWYRDRDRLLRTPAGPPGTPISPSPRWVAFICFLNELYLSFKRKGTPISMQQDGVNPALIILKLLAECCIVSLRAPAVNSLPELECVFIVLTGVGRDLENALPAKMSTVINTIRDSFLSLDVTESARKTLLQMIEMHSARWQLPATAVTYYYPSVTGGGSAF